MQVKDQNTYYHTLKNGLRIVHRHTSSPVAYLGLMVGAGTRDEDPKQNGMAHYIEHTVFKGTQHRTARQIINRIENIGGDINAYTTKEETTYYAATLVEYFSRTMELLADMVMCPTFPKKEIEKEREVIFDEIQSYNDSPSELIYDDFENLIFSGHPLQMPILGTKKTLRSLNQKKALYFLQENYTPQRMVFFSIGNLPFCRVIHYAEKYLEYYQPQSTLGSSRQAPTTLERGATATYHKHTHQTHVMLGTRAYPIGHENQLGLYFLNNIIGGSGMNSLLNLALREQRGLVYTIESNYTPLSDTGYWATYFASEAQDIDQCLSLIYKQLATLREKPLSDTTFRKYLRQLLGQMAIAAENPENNALTMAKSVLYKNTASPWQDVYAHVAQFTPADLYRIGNELFEEKNISTLLYQ